MPNVIINGYMRLPSFLTLILISTAGACMSPAASGIDLNSGKDQVTAETSNDDLKPPSDINQSYSFAGSCIYPQGFCVQVYASDPAAAITQLIVMGKKSCRILPPGKGKPQCADLFTKARCIGTPFTPEYASAGTEIQMDLYFDSVPDEKGKASCTDNGGTFQLLSKG